MPFWAPASRARRAIRSTVERELAEREQMSAAQIAECFTSVLDDPGALDVADLLGSDDAQRKELGPDRSKLKETSGAAGP